MPKKKFEEDDSYNPIGSELARNAASAASTAVTVVDGGKNKRRRASRPKPKPSTPHTATPKPPTTARPPAEVERPARWEETVRKKFRLTTTEDYELRDFVARIQKASRRKVPEAILTRCAVKQLIQAEAQLVEELKRRPLLDQPSTNDHLRYAEYEEQWLRAVNRAFRDMPPIG